MSFNKRESLTVTIISEDFPPNVGGIAQWAKGISDGLHEHNVKVNVHCRYFDTYPPDVNKLKCEYTVVYHQRKNWKRKRTFYWKKIFQAQLEKGVIPDYCIATTWNVSRGLIRLCKQYNVKLVTIAHGLEVTRKMPLIKKLWLRHTLKNCFKVIAVSNYTKGRILKDYKINEHKVRVLPNGVDYNRFKPTGNTVYLRNRYQLNGKKIIMTLSRVTERKGHDLVLDAMQKIKGSLGNVVYLIAGPDSRGFTDILKHKVAELGLDDHVYFSGYVDSMEIVDHYNLCDIYVMQSRYLEAKGDVEGFGITFLEANACEKPVIGGDSGGVSDAIEDGFSGFLVEPEDVDSLAEKLLKLISDDEMATTMGKNGRERVLEGYNWPVLSKRLIELIEK